MLNLIPLLTKYYMLVFRVVIIIYAANISNTNYIVIVNTLLLAEFLYVLLDFGMDFYYVRSLKNSESSLTKEIFFGLGLVKIFVFSMFFLVLATAKYLLLLEFNKIDIYLLFLWWLNLLLFPTLINTLSHFKKWKSFYLICALHAFFMLLFVQSFSNNKHASEPMALAVSVIILITSLFVALYKVKIESSKLLKIRVQFKSNFVIARKYWMTSIIVALYSRLDLITISYFGNQISAQYLSYSKSIEILLLLPALFSYRLALINIKEKLFLKIIRFNKVIVMFCIVIVCLCGLLYIIYSNLTGFDITIILILMAATVRGVVIMTSGLLYSKWSDDGVRSAAIVVLLMHLTNLGLTIVFNNYFLFLNILFLIELINYLIQSRKLNLLTL